jgi:hypothetical protein
MRFQTVALAVVVALVLVACASPPSRDVERIALLADYINTASAEDLVAQTKTPFLFQNEVLVRESQVRSMWENLKADGFTLGTPLDEPYWLHEEDYGLVSDTADVRRLFDRLSSDATFVKADSNIGEVWLILTGNNADLALVQGLGRSQ